MIVILLAMLLSAGILGAACAEALPAAEQTADWLSNDVLMTFFDHSMFVGDSQMAKFRDYVKRKWSENPDFFSNVDFRAENSYLFRFVGYKFIPSAEKHYIHLTDGGEDTTLYEIVKKKLPQKIFVLAGLNDALTTDYTMEVQGRDETGYDRAARYVREMTELVREVSPETEIYVISQMPVAREFKQGINDCYACRDRFDLVNTTVQAECEKLGIRYLDLATGLKDKEGLMPEEYCESGWLHLNDAGYAVFARELLDFAQAEYEAGRWTPISGSVPEE
jgi:lysophospholipase L1-like esterase